MPPNAEQDKRRNGKPKNEKRQKPPRRWPEFFAFRAKTWKFMLDINLYSFRSPKPTHWVIILVAAIIALTCCYVFGGI